MNTQNTTTASFMVNANAVGRGALSILPLIFLFFLLVPIIMRIGPLTLLPHRLMLVVVFFPLFFRLLSGKVGRLRMIDLGMIFSVAWATLSIFVSVGSGKVEAIGIYWVEFLGAYLIGRVCIRSSADFYRFSKFYFLAILVLLPFAFLEAVLHRPILLDLIPNSHPWSPMERRWGMSRVQSVFSHPILFGVFVSCGFGLFWYVLRPTVLRVFGTWVAGVATVLSLSTGALLSVVTQAILILWELMTKPSKWRWRVFALGVILAYVLVDLLSNRSPFHVLVSYGTFNTGNSYNRILIWEYGTKNVYARPFLGLGLDLPNWDRPTWMHASADNFWLLIAMAYGIPSLLGLVTGVVLIIGQVSRAVLHDPLARACRAGFLTALGGLIIAGGTVHYWHGMLSFVMFLFGSGVWMIDAQDQAPTEDEAANTDDKPAGSRYTRFAPDKQRGRFAPDKQRGSLAPVSDRAPAPDRAPAFNRARASDRPPNRAKLRR